MAHTLVHNLREWADKQPTAPAVHVRGPDGWKGKTWREYDQIVRTVAKALIALGVKAGEAVTIIGRNRPEWLYAQFGSMSAGAVPAPIYATETPAQTAYVVNHSGARVAIVEDKTQYDKLVVERANLKLEKVVLMDDVAGRDAAWTMLWPEFTALGEKADPAELERRFAALKPEDLAFLCYTSGTTGKPKGVMLSNANLMFMTRVVNERFKLDHERTMSYLPLCHIAEQGFTNFIQLGSGGEVFMCDDLAKVKDFLPEVRPTLFLGVPRVWEKFQAALTARLAEATGVKAKLAAWALRTELAAFKRDVETGTQSIGLARKLARKLVISKVKAKLGLDRVKYSVTGAAPIGVPTMEFFASLGLPINEAYGMTETTAILTTTLPGMQRFGTVGVALDGVELRIAEDGEILARGPNLTKGYFKEETQTAELWEGGWLHTGDVGVLEADGYLRITDRKKELFKTSGGKYVAPQAIEGKMKTIRGLSQAVAIGDGRKYIGAVLTLDPENAPKVAAEIGVSGDLASLATNDRMREHIQREIDTKVNAQLARYEQVKKFVILPQDLSVAGGELTPTMKLRRKVIAQKHAGAIEGLFAEEASAAAVS